MTNPTKWHVRPAKTQIGLGINPVWSESSLSAWRKLGSLATHWAHSEDSDQTGRMPRLIWVMPFRWFCHVAAQMWLASHSPCICYTFPGFVSMMRAFLPTACFPSCFLADHKIILKIGSHHFNVIDSMCPVFSTANCKKRITLF